MKKKNIIIIIIVFIGVSFGSYLAFQQFFGEKKSYTTTGRIELENYAQQVKIDNTKAQLLAAENSPDENMVELVIDTTQLSRNVKEEYFESETSEGGTSEKMGSEPATQEDVTTQQDILTVHEETYETAKQTPGTVLVIKELTSGTKTPPYWMFSISIAVIISTILGAGLLTKQELRGNATSKLLEEGLEGLTVRDVEIFSQIMKMGEFTIPELMRKTETSKVTTWRTVKKLVEEELVEETDEKKPPSRGLGGRGKPSKVYRFKE